MTQTPAGWHPAPDRPGQLRYWDGAGWTDHYSPGPAPAPKPKSRKLGLIVVAVAVLMFGVVLAIALASDDPTGTTAGDDTASQTEPEEPDYGDEISAQVVCEDFVERQLKAPSTAEFGDETVTQVKGPVWQVVGEVDAENGFGAMIRANYVCRVKFTGDDNWQLVRMSGLN